MKAVCLISGGIDSPVAAHLMLSKGVDLEFAYFETTNPATPKVKKLVAHLEKLHNKKFRLHIVPHAQVMEVMAESDYPKALCVICRRTMLRVAERLAKDVGARAILTGENLSQVASQTLDNIFVETHAVKIPILRPLIGFEKEDIIKIARKIGTYELSIGEGGCCCLLPDFPMVNANLGQIEQIEGSVDIPQIIEEEYKGAEVQ